MVSRRGAAGKWPHPCHILFRQYPEENVITLAYRTCWGSGFEICTSRRINVERVKECWIFWKSWLFMYTHLIFIAVGGGSRKEKINSGEAVWQKSVGSIQWRNTEGVSLSRWSTRSHLESGQRKNEHRFPHISLPSSSFSYACFSPFPWRYQLCVAVSLFRNRVVKNFIIGIL